jgi:uncharacterized protein (TIGR00369 family)
MNRRLEHFQAKIGALLDDESSPMTRWLGGRLVAISEGEVTMEFTVRREMTNPTGVLHGGIHAAILDDIIGLIVHCLGRETYFTSINLTIDFLGRAMVGDQIIAKAKVLRAGNQIVNITGEIFNKDGNIISRATSNMVRTNVKID